MLVVCRLALDVWEAMTVEERESAAHTYEAAPDTPTKKRHNVVCRDRALRMPVNHSA
jgi:hypothetical protein